MGAHRMSCFVCIIVFLFLLIGTIQDIRRKSVSSWIFLFFLPASLFQYLLGDKVPIWDIFLGVGVGVVFFLISKVTAEQLGRADAYAMIAFGGLFGGLFLLKMLCYVFLISFICSFILLILRKVKKHTTIPLYPFMLVGYVCMIV